MYKVEIKSVEKKEVVAFVIHTTFVKNRQAEEIPPFFHKVMEENTLESVPNRINSNQICVFDKRQNSPEFDYYMGVEVSNKNDVPEGMGTITIPDCKFATTSFIKRGNPDALKAFMFLTEKWIPENGYEQNFDAPAFIYYDDRFIPIFKEKGYEGNPIAEIYIPVR